MGSIEPALVEQALTPIDAEAALLLSDEAGWNQTAADWRFMLSQGRGIGVRDGERRIGSALTLPLGEKLSWISMVLVAKSARRRGIGTSLLRRCIDLVLNEGGIAGLDATELGRPVYLPLGFRELWSISRLRLEAPAKQRRCPAGMTIRRLVPADLPALAAFDASRSGMQRAHVLAYLLGQAPHNAFVAETGGRVVGYVMGKPGRTAFQVGPIVADGEAVAVSLASTALGNVSGPVILDVPDAHAALQASLFRAGAARQRGYIRMTLGDPPAGLRNAGAVFALAGPELG